MDQIILIFVCLAIGVVLRLSGRLPDRANKVLDGWVINIALPAAALHNLHGLKIDHDWWLAAATPWIGACLAMIVILPLCRMFQWSRQRAGALLLVSGWGNTSFVGLPMIAAFAGHQWLGLGMVIDLFGSYLALSTFGLAIATAASSGRFDWRVVFKRITTFPPFLAILLALVTNHLDRPQWLEQALLTFSQTLIPLALVAVGYALRLDRFSGRITALGVGLSYRLLFAPLAVVLMYLLLRHASDPVPKVAMLESAMPPMLGASIIAIDHDLEPDLVAVLIGIGVPLSTLTAWLWWSVISPL